MENFIYKGFVVAYEIRDGKVIVSSVFDGSAQKDCDNIFGSVGEMRRYIDAGGWRTDI